MPVTETKEWTASSDPAEVKQRLAGEVARQGGEVVSTEPFVAKTGAFWKTRLLGFIFMSSSDLPMTIRVVVEEAQTGVRVQATVSDRFGLAIRIGVEGRLRTQCMSLLDALEEASRAS